MADLVFTITIAVYAASSTLFLLQLAGSTSNAVRWATPLVGAGALGHLLYITLTALGGASPTAGIQQALTSFSVMLIVTYLLVERRYRLRVLGAFVTPLTLLMLLSARFARAGQELPHAVRSVLLPIHITANLLGDVAFALAFALALAYLIQERQLKKKRFGGVFSRLPSLDVLDVVSFRCVTIGFPLLTIGIVLGAVVARKMGSEAFFSPAQVLAVLTWLLFAGVLALRVAAGWRGRRAAIGTVLGFLMAAGVLLSYLLRSGGGGT